MPLPIPVIIALAVAVVGGAAAAVNWKKVKARIAGKRFAVLGPRRVGKTTFLNFLQTGEITDAYRPTLAPEKFPVSARALGAEDEDESFDILLKQGVDVSGQKAAYANWQRITKTADVVVYLFRADLVFNGDQEHLGRIRTDMGQIAGWLKERSDKPAVYLVGTHCDLHPQLEDLEDADVHDNFTEIEAMRDAGRRVDAKTILIGSLRDAALARGLVIRLFKHLTNV